MTLTEILDSLRTMKHEASLLFSTAAETIGAGYHVTELKAADITSIDCGGNVSKWKEASLQLLDGKNGTYMTVGTFVEILEHSLQKIEALRMAPVHAEFSHRNEGLRRFELALFEADSDKVEFRLSDVRAVCKPAMSGQGKSCCGNARAAESVCCN